MTRKQRAIGKILERYWAFPQLPNFSSEIQVVHDYRKTHIMARITRESTSSKGSFECAEYGTKKDELTWEIMGPVSTPTAEDRNSCDLGSALPLRSTATPRILANPGMSARLSVQRQSPNCPGFPRH